MVQLEPSVSTMQYNVMQRQMVPMPGARNSTGLGRIAVDQSIDSTRLLRQKVWAAGSLPA